MAGWIYAPAFFVLKLPVALARAPDKIKGVEDGWRFCFAWTLVNCYNGKAGVSLLEEARSKDNEADNAKGRFCPPALSGFEENLSTELVTQESIMDPML